MTPPAPTAVPAPPPGPATVPRSRGSKVAPVRPLVVALVGNPNTGKSTLFNALCGARARTGNFPGVTVEKKVGRLKLPLDGVAADRAAEVIDLPGTYSLSPRSADEMVSVDVLLGDAGGGALRTPRPDAVVCVVDASNLHRNLYLVSQVLELGLPVVIALNMGDVARLRGTTIDVPALSQKLGVPVIPTEAHRRRGLNELRAAIVAAAAGPAPQPVRSLPDAVSEEADVLDGWLAEHGCPDVPAYLRERMLLDVGGQVVERYRGRCTGDLPAHLGGVRARLAEAGCRVPAVEAAGRYGWAREMLNGTVETAVEPAATASDKIDRFLTHRVWGLLTFAVLMFLVFQAIFSWAGPFMDAIGEGQGWLTGLVQDAMPPGAFRSLIIDGVIAGVGGVLIFLPQIVILFLAIAVLEDCGYMARAAFLMDRLMSRLGLSGKSFVPLMSSFACAVPGVMATRVIENRRDRMVTILVAPLMSCSARLPVYLLLIGAFVPATAYLGGLVELQGLVLFGITSLGALVAIPVAWLLRKTWFKGETPPFVMELPPYRWPSLRNVALRVYDRGKAFVTRAGTLIFAATVLVWAAGYFPGDHTELHAVQAQIESESAEAEPDETVLEALELRRRRLSSDLIEASVLGRTGHAIEPVVKPLGWDWRIGVGALASFPAREVIIATLGTIYSLGGDVDETDDGLRDALRRSEWPDGDPVYTLPVALSVMVFFALCAQCAATLMVIKRETNSWRWPLFTFVYMTALAYIGALLTYQIGSRLF
ncbi:ferrous iron transport protein B [Alienimonas californiensis]|uniref:Ferrous iron transport protein B n=1 Tax=Alienimonas californiensis TaxID=2527989 RepID=A0A517P3Z9_9PLAN|nr:ferrous iron transport protein B [Alienimonas californiensis]QDT14063.1 Ferrous iron transport protein B [Alienimonas californiensis]